MNWDNKIVIITGANTGIGKATKDLLRSKGCIVYNFDLSMVDEDMHEYYIQCDIRNRQQIRKAVEEVYNRETSDVRTKPLQLHFLYLKIL